MCASILLQNTNKNCNYFQSILGVFYLAVLVPKKVIEMLAHAGLSVSLTSINKIITALSAEATRKLHNSVRTLTMALAYDNFNMAFQVVEPTVEHHSTFISATSATAVPIYGLVNKEDLRCLWQLWSRDPNNPEAIDPVIIDLGHLDSFHSSDTCCAPGEKLSPYMKQIAWHIWAILIRHGPSVFSKYTSQLGEPVPINRILLHKTEQVPCQAMKIKESTQDGNIQVLENLLAQGGLGKPGNDGFMLKALVDLTEWILLVHGDLMTKEHIDSIKATRKIEDTPRRRFQYVVFIPGLFHYLIACADVIWNTWVQPMATCEDPNSLVHHVNTLRSGDTKKFVSKPGFQMIHQVIQHDIWASMLDCWRLVAHSQNNEWMSLEAFGNSEPAWDVIVELSEEIASKYVASPTRISELGDELPEDRDKIFKHQILRNRDELDYLELHDAMSMGDIG
ncbi:hypothetical protein NP233_g9638 [Leucocoprinus birnbaumii]|uniref:DUF6589 domain-containing protein n=1 Tax=Leucocoprinus birnbaumii TaxID=56174 RepID=A0AAD5YSN3_9AGAR|nr:hypothetical protein NP233_g9638 [Leucocoprinus birnbaumii]